MYFNLNFRSCRINHRFFSSQFFLKCCVCVFRQHTVKDAEILALQRIVSSSNVSSYQCDEGLLVFRCSRRAWSITWARRSRGCWPTWRARGLCFSCLTASGSDAALPAVCPSAACRGQRLCAALLSLIHRTQSHHHSSPLDQGSAAWGSGATWGSFTPPSWLLLGCCQWEINSIGCLSVDGCRPLLFSFLKLLFTLVVLSFVWTFPLIFSPDFYFGITILIQMYPWAWDLWLMLPVWFSLTLKIDAELSPNVCRVWDKVISGSCKILVFVALEILLSYKIMLLGINRPEGVVNFLSNVSDGSRRGPPVPCPALTAVLSSRSRRKTRTPLWPKPWSCGRSTAGTRFTLCETFPM